MGQRGAESLPVFATSRVIGPVRIGAMTAQIERTRQFTVAAANRTLPLVRMIVSDIVELFREVTERRDRLRALERSSDGPVREGDLYREEVEQVQRVLEQDEARLLSFINELQELGVELKDPAVGLVDFPTAVNGRPAYLCWKLGENELAFWHGKTPVSPGASRCPTRQPTAPRCDCRRLVIRVRLRYQYNFV